MRLFVDVTFSVLPLEQQLLPKCNGLAKSHFSCCSQLSLLLFESFYCFPIFSILALSLLSLLAKSHLIQILSLVHLCYYLLYPFYVMYPSHLNFTIIKTQIPDAFLTQLPKFCLPSLSFFLRGTTTCSCTSYLRHLTASLLSQPDSQV